MTATGLRANEKGKTYVAEQPRNPNKVRSFVHLQPMTAAKNKKQRRMKQGWVASLRCEAFLNNMWKIEYQHIAQHRQLSLPTVTVYISDSNGRQSDRHGTTPLLWRRKKGDALLSYESGCICADSGVHHLAKAVSRHRDNGPLHNKCLGINHPVIPSWLGIENRLS